MKSRIIEFWVVVLAGFSVALGLGLFIASRSRTPAVAAVSAKFPTVPSASMWPEFDPSRMQPGDKACVQFPSTTLEHHLWLDPKAFSKVAGLCGGVSRVATRTQTGWRVEINGEYLEQYNLHDSYFKSGGWYEVTEIIP